MAATSGQTIAIAVLQRMRNAREAALSADLDGDLTEAIDLVVQRLSRGVPLNVVVAELYRAGYRAGHVDGAGDRAVRTRIELAEQQVVNELTKAA
jgi:hypothetical protein